MTAPRPPKGRERRTGERETLLERVGERAAGIASAGPSDPRRKALLQYGIAALIFGSLIFFVARQWSKLPDFDWRFEPGWLALSAVCVAGFYFAQCELWRRIIAALGSPLPARPARAIWGKSLVARYVPTNALMVVGRVLMAERLGVSKRITLASIVYELGIAFGTAVMMGAYFVIDLPDLEGQSARYAVLVLIPAVLVALHPRVFGPLVNLALRKLGREELPVTLGFPRVLGLCALYVLTWCVIGLGVFSFAAALHPIEAGDLPYLVASYPVAFCVAVLTFVVPSGIGTRDATLATAMAAVLAGTVATAIAVAFRIVQTAVELLYVAAVVALDKRDNG